MPDKAGYLGALREDAAALIAAAASHFTVPVPSCPGWHVIDLVVHTGAVHRAHAAVIAERATQAQGIRREMFSSVPGLTDWLDRSALFGRQSDLAAIPAGVAEWFRAGAALLIGALAGAAETDRVWSWSADQTVRHHLRMMSIETAIHRWDAQGAVGVPEPVRADLALDGIVHTFEVMAPYRRSIREAAPGRGQSYRWVAAENDGTWTSRFRDDEVTITRDDPGPADVSVSASASDLLLFLWGRLPAAALDVTGELAVLDQYFGLVPRL